MQGYKSIFTKISFLFFGVLLVIFQLSPIGHVPQNRFNPDFLFCFIFIFLIRSPQNVSMLSILIISLLADFLWFRPLGLASITTLIASELLRKVLIYKHRLGYLEELTCVFIILTSMFTLQEAIKSFTIISRLAFQQVVNHVLFTFLLYAILTLLVVFLKKSKFARQ